MLVVSRRPGQSFLIGGDIEVFVIGVDGTQVRVGINAPRAIRVLRRELLTQVESENRRAVGSGLSQPDDLDALAQHLRPSGEETMG
jgi:carbon storage regulator